jgi:hypothetical protein
MDIVVLIAEEDKRVLAEGLEGEKTDTTYEKVMRLLQCGFNDAWWVFDTRMETQRVQLMWKAKRNRGFCEVKGCRSSVWAHTPMHWHHNLHTHTEFTRWISWYRFGGNMDVYVEEMEKCTLLCAHHHKIIHTIDAALKYDREIREKKKEEEKFKGELTDQGVYDEYYIAKALREHRRLQ